MSLKFYLGQAGAGKSTKLQNDILQRMKDEPNRHFFVITPDQYTMQTQKDLVLKAPNKGLMNIDILSFSRLAYRIFEEVGTKELFMLDDTGKNLILRKLAFDNEDSLVSIAGNIKKNGYIHEIKSAISEFMQYGLSVDDVISLSSFCKSKPLLSYKLKDLATMYRAFLEYIENRFLTTEEKLEVLANEIYKSEIAKGCIVVFDGFTGFTPVQHKVISSLLSVADEVWMSYTVSKEALKENGSDSELFELTLKSMKAITQIAKNNNIDIEPSECIFDEVVRHKENKQLLHLENNIFRYPSKKYDDKCDAIKINCLSTPREELCYVAMTIRKMINENNMAYRDFAVVTGDLERYAPYAPEIFEKYNISYFIDSNTKLEINPFSELIKAGLLIIENDYSYDSVIHFLRSGITGISNEETDMLDNYIRALGIRGRKKYLSDFAKYPQYMKERIDGTYTVTEKSREMLENINSIRIKFSNKIMPLTQFTKNVMYKASEITKCLYKFIYDNDTFDKLKCFENSFREKGEEVKAREYSQIYDKIIILLEQICEIIGDEELTINQYYQIFEAGLTEIKIGILPPSVDVCPIGDIQRTRLNNVKCLFVVGANDGVIPASSSSSGIISDIDREYILQSEYELSPSPREKMYIQKFYLYNLLSSPTENLYISYSKMNGKGEALRPSYLINTLKSLFTDLKEEYIYDLVNADNMFCRENVIDAFSEEICRYSSCYMDDDELENLGTLYHAMCKLDSKVTNDLVDAAFYKHNQEKLGKQIVQIVYGNILANSISRLEKYAGCAYSHFLKYGLKLKEREEFSFQNVDMGNLYHRVLQQYGNELRNRDIKWQEISQDEAKKILDTIIDNETASYGESVIFDTARSEYTVERLKRILLRTVMTTKYQLSKGLYNPKRFELRFKHEMDINRVKVGLDNEEKMIISGTIDRLDTYEKENGIYVKVVDYKSSSHDIDLVELYYGRSLQVVVYLDQAVRNIKELHGEKDVIPAAMLYYHVDDPIIEGRASLDEDEINAEIQKKLKVKGLVNSDEEVISSLDISIEGVNGVTSDVIPVSKKKDGSIAATSKILDREGINTIMEYANMKMAEHGKEILEGNIDVKPCSKTQCNNCAYKDICEFDIKLDGYSYKNDEVIDKKNVLNIMKEKIGG